MKIIRIFKRIFGKKEYLLFETHTPGDWCKPGTLHHGSIVTKIKRTSDTLLIDGERAPCWQVYGRKLPPSEITDE